MRRLFHDFIKLYPGPSASMRSAPLVCAGTKRDLDAMQLTLEPGMRVVLYQPDGITEGGAGFQG